LLASEIGRREETGESEKADARIFLGRNVVVVVVRTRRDVYKTTLAPMILNFNSKLLAMIHVQ